MVSSLPNVVFTCRALKGGQRVAGVLCEGWLAALLEISVRQRTIVLCRSLVSYGCLVVEQTSKHLGDQRHSIPSHGWEVGTLSKAYH